METAALIGLRILDFWELTPKELNFAARAYRKQAQQEHEEKVSLVYLGAYLARVKKMPSLKSLLEPESKKKVQNPEAMFAEIKRLNAAFGGVTAE
jgi:hypothetical protein